MIDLHLNHGNSHEGVYLRLPATPGEIGAAFGLLDILCGDSYRLTSLCELSKADFVTEGTLREQLQERVRAMVEDTVDNDRGNLPVSEVTNLHLKRNLDYYLEYGVKEDAIRHLFADGAFLVSGYQAIHPMGWRQGQVALADQPAVPHPL